MKNILALFFIHLMPTIYNTVYLCAVDAAIQAAVTPCVWSECIYLPCIVCCTTCNKFRINRNGILQHRNEWAPWREGVIAKWIEWEEWETYELRRHFVWILNSLYELKAFHFVLYCIVFFSKKKKKRETMRRSL